MEDTSLSLLVKIKSSIFRSLVGSLTIWWSRVVSHILTSHNDTWHCTTCHILTMSLYYLVITTLLSLHYPVITLPTIILPQHYSTLTIKSDLLLPNTKLFKINMKLWIKNILILNISFNLLKSAFINVHSHLILQIRHFHMDVVYQYSVKQWYTASL